RHSCADFPAGARRRGDRVKRREFITLVGAIGALWSYEANAQKSSKVWKLGMLDTTPKALNERNIAGLRKGLGDLGYFEGRNLQFDYRSTDGNYEISKQLVGELLEQRPDALVVRGTPQLIAAANATRDVPIIMAAIADPLGT